jgi:hypothetical protein
VGNLIELLAVSINPPNLAFTIGGVGIVVAIARRRWDLLVWVGVTVFGVAVLDRWLAVPLAILAGYAVDHALSHWNRLATTGLAAAAIASVGTGIILAAPNEALTIEQREVMASARNNTRHEATFAVIGYPVDRGFVEWFPALAERQNLTTWQGTEWILNGLTRKSAEMVARCRTVGCLSPVDYYVVREGCCPELDRALREVGPKIFRETAGHH